ncbi:SCO4225 family membrane protein [Streptomyces coryli]|uniref:SCO4225 family membrane protein n=1 Tax=Streptomyces coryli TaxID=1128680 RepID=UPI001F0E3C3A|nr:hypothetical protein [Streptomyces coryli]
MRNTSLPRRLLALATDNWLSRGYLAAFATSAALAVVAPDHDVLGVAPMLLTAPLSFFGIAVPFGPGTEGGGAVQVLAIAATFGWLGVCALVNAAVLGALAHEAHGRRAARHA